MVVEYINGKVQSYMTERSYAYFTSMKDTEVIPVTTRTKAQYDRLSELTAKLGVRYAMICNGGILLDNGEVDRQWLTETYELIGNAADELRKAAEKMKSLSVREVHETDDIMIYTVTDDPEAMKESLRETLDIQLITVFSDNRKVYCIPSVINKGSAVRRFNERFGYCRNIAAGDGVQDIPMLEAADAAICAADNGKYVNSAHKIIADTSAVFSDSVCDALKQLNI